MTQQPRIPIVDRTTIDDPQILSLLNWADEHSTPRPSWIQLTANNPELCRARGEFWRGLFWGGTVPHATKELVRRVIVEIQECQYCTSQRSVSAGDVNDTIVESCTLPDFSHPEPRIQAALRFAREITLHQRDDAVWDSVYAELNRHYAPGDIVELGIFASWCAGMSAFVHSTAIYRLGEGAQRQPTPA